jgi:hypothetical protein
MTVFPTLTPSSRVFTLGDYSHAPLRSMGGTQTQVRHSNVIVGAGLELQFIGRSEANMLSIRTHYINRRGTFNVFTLPSAIWVGTTDPTPASYTWRYTEQPRVSEDGNGHYDIAVKLEMMPPDPSGDIASTQDVVILVPNGAIRAQALAPGFEETGATLVPAATITVQGQVPTIGTGTVDVPAGAVSIQALAPDYGEAVAYAINLLLNGSNGSTTITDSSANNFSATVNGSAQISTAQSVSGGASLLLDGTGDYVVFGPSSQFTFGTGDFEIAFDIRPSVVNSNDGLFDICSAAGGDLEASGNFGASIFNGSLSVRSIDTGSAPTLNTWQRYRIARFGGNLRVAKDGTQVYTAANTVNYTGTYLNVGLYYGDAYTYEGYMDNFAISKGSLIEPWPS